MEGLTQIVFAAGLVFARTGAMVMLLPGFSQPGPPPRIRLAFALVLSLALGPAVAPLIPPMPSSAMQIAGLIISEVIIGLVFGAAARLLLAALAVAGQVAGLQTGLGMAQTFDPSQGQQGALFSAFLNVTGIALLFVSGMHHLFLEGLRSGYELIPPGDFPAPGDIAELGLGTFANAFAVAIRMTAPLIVFGLVFYFAIGVLSRLMPQAQIFFMAMPSTILAGLAILAATLGGAMLIWLRMVEDFAMGLG